MISQLRREQTTLSWREKVFKEKGKFCPYCGSKENLEIHHIMEITKGGTNDLFNLIVVCQICHAKIHNKHKRDYSKNGRPRLITFEDAEPILKRYFDLEIGTKETKELLGISIKNKSTFETLKKEYKEKYNISKTFKNTLDVKNWRKDRL